MSLPSASKHHLTGIDPRWVHRHLTGSTYTWIDARVLRGLGIVPTGRWAFETIEGREASRRLDEAVVSYGAVRATTVVVFARRKDAQVLGVHALEGLRLAVDPATQRLRRLRSVLAVRGSRRQARRLGRACMAPLSGPGDFSDLAGTVSWRRTTQEYKDGVRRLART